MSIYGFCFALLIDKVVISVYACCCQCGFVVFASVYVKLLVLYVCFVVFYVDVVVVCI